jgi:broad specificity phosphatase PhoE
MPSERIVDLLVVRHGHVEGIVPERFRGRTDLTLTPQGEQQAAEAAKTIAARWKPAAVYTSPLRRCIVTGAAIARACAVAPKVLDTLNDLNYGTWQWKTPGEVRSRDSELLDRWYDSPQLVRFPGGESLQDAALRAADAIRFALDYHLDSTIVYVTHDSMIRIMLLQCLGMPLDAYWRFSPQPCSIDYVRLSVRGARVVKIDDAPADS